ncbi:MAG: TetR/AcrR family transcriptional regulator [Solirubrobacteraceae bacterium]
MTIVYHVKAVSAPSRSRPRRTQAERLELSGRRLLKAAAELIVEKGWEGTTGAEIGRRAGYSRAMVHARYGSNEALLDTLLRTEYEERLSPTPDPTATGLQQVLAHFDNFEELFQEDPQFLESMFALSFEAVKRATPVRPRIIAWMNRIAGAVESGLRSGIEDGSVRREIDIDHAVTDIVAAGVGIAYGWIVLPQRYALPGELERIRTRVIRDYGS